MEKWLADNILKLLGTIAACGWFLIQLGEWKARMQERKRAEALHVTPQPHDGTTRESIELLVMRELVDARRRRAAQCAAAIAAEFAPAEIVGEDEYDIRQLRAIGHGTYSEWNPRGITGRRCWQW